MNKTLAYYVSALRKDFVLYCNEQLQEIGLSQGLLYFLIYIGNHKGCSPSSIAAGLNADTGHTTRSLDRLSELHFVVRRKNQQDRRAYELHLTKEGEEAFQKARTLFKEWDKKMLEDLGEEKASLLYDLLDEIITEKEDCSFGLHI